MYNLSIRCPTHTQTTPPISTRRPTLDAVLDLATSSRRERDARRSLASPTFERMGPLERLTTWIRQPPPTYHPSTLSSSWIRRWRGPQVDYSARLPPELLFSIIQHTLPTNHSSPNLPERYRALCAYSRVSRIWRSVAQPELFRVVQLPSPVLAFFFTSAIFMPFNDVELMSRVDAAFLGTPQTCASGGWRAGLRRR